MPLIVLGVIGQLFSPNNTLSGPGLYGLGVIQIGISLSVLYGGLARAGGAALCLLWLLGTYVVGLESMLENAHYLGRQRRILVQMGLLACRRNVPPCPKGQPNSADSHGYRDRAIGRGTVEEIRLAGWSSEIVPPIVP